MCEKHIFRLVFFWNRNAFGDFIYLFIYLFQLCFYPSELGENSLGENQLSEGTHSEVCYLIIL